jgi:hypothetical protein
LGSEPGYPHVANVLEWLNGIVLILLGLGRFFQRKKVVISRGKELSAGSLTLDRRDGASNGESGGDMLGLRFILGIATRKDTKS